MNYEAELLKALQRFHSLGINEQIDYDKFYLYSLITHSTAIEGSTVTEIENQLLFDEGISAKGRTIAEQMMNLDLKAAYEKSIAFANSHTKLSVDLLKELSATVMRNTGQEYHTALGTFNSTDGDLRLLNVTAGVGGRSYLNYSKVPAALQEFCDWLNAERTTIANKDVLSVYNLSFEAHYKLVTIHPWADGNGRMSRLIMNYLQFENKVIPSKIAKENKADYIQALVDTRESGDTSIFREFMLREHTRNLLLQINQFEQSQIADVPTNVPINVPAKSTVREERIVDIMRYDPSVSMLAISKMLRVSDKTIKRDIANLKVRGIISREGATKNGKWIVLR